MTSKFCPLGFSAPDLWLYTFLNHETMCIKSEVEKFLFKLATNDHSDEAFQAVDIKILTLMGAKGLCLNFFSSITADFVISAVLR